VVALLRTIPRLEQCPYIFSTNGRTSVSGFSKATALSTELTDVAGWRVHDLRRSAATHMAELQIPKGTIRRVLGHTESDVTEIYIRRSWIHEKRSALDAWAAFVTKRVRRAK
jgi:integrase